MSHATGPLSPLTVELSTQVCEQLRQLLVQFDEMRTLATTPDAWMPPVDVCELEQAILVRIELPGVAREQVRLTLRDHSLKVEGRKERANLTCRLLPEDERPLRFICLERTYGSFAFSLALRWPIDAAQVSAQMADGVLQIKLPKTSACGREITIPVTE